MDLSAILNEEHASAYQKSISTASDSSHDATTPRTPMEHSPIVACHSQSPEDRRLRSGEEMYQRYSEVRGSPEAWKGPQMTSMHQPRSPIGQHEGRARSQAHRTRSRGDATPSPASDSFRGHPGWPAGPIASPTHESHARGGYASPTDYGPGSGRSEDHSRLPSVHDLLMQPEYMNASFAAHGAEAAYDTDATISDSERAGSGGTSPTASGSSASGPSAAGMGRGAQRCAFVADCNLGVPPRRIVSHYFGRNKKETRAIPESVWVFYCRQHYQRAKYRQRTHVYAQTQMALVRQTVENLERWGGVTDFAVSLRKRAVHQLRHEDEWAAAARRSAAAAAAGSQSQPPPPPPSQVCEERWLLPFIGTHKSFQEVYDVIERVAERSRLRQCPAAEFELVPNIKPQYMGRRSSRAGAGSGSRAVGSGGGAAHTGRPLGRPVRSQSFEGESGFSDDEGFEE